MPEYRIDKDTFPSNLYPNMVFINPFFLCAGLSMLNAEDRGSSARGTGQQNELITKSTKFVLQKVRHLDLW